MNDLAVITGGTVVSEEVGLSLDKSDVSVLGRAKSVSYTHLTLPTNREV